MERLGDLRSWPVARPGDRPRRVVSPTLTLPTRADGPTVFRGQASNYAEGVIAHSPGSRSAPWGEVAPREWSTP